VLRIWQFGVEIGFGIGKDVLRFDDRRSSLVVCKPRFSEGLQMSRQRNFTRVAEFGHGILPDTLVPAARVLALLLTLALLMATGAAWIWAGGR
jgi:hypothetical protein